jgi:integrase
MGNKWFTGGVVAAPRGRIQFDFIFNGVRYRPSIKRPPSEANLRRARERLEAIKQQIRLGTFSFEEEFPDYRFLPRVSGTSNTRLCNEVFDAYLAHCEARFRRGDMAGVTVTGYRKVIDGVWRRYLGKLVFSQVRYSRLIRIADGRCWSKKTYNNAVSVLKRAFDFGYRDRPFHENPALNLRCARLKKSDRPKVDPFCMHDAETLIAGIHRDWGEAQGNYDEFRFFTGLRPSEQIALVVDDIDLVNGIISVNKARVSGVDRCQTKTGEDRRVQLCPRALSVLKRHLLLRARLKAAGKIHHDYVFFLETGEPFRTLHYPQLRWRKTLQSLKLRYRRPYTARQTSVSWSLMVGKNPLWVAKQHGHSIATMLRAYAAWAEGAAEVDVEAIKRSMDQTVPLPPENLAADLPVDNGIQTLSAPPYAPTSSPGPSSSLLNQQEKMEEKIVGVVWLGWKDYSAPLRCVPHPLGRPGGRYPPTSPHKHEESAYRRPLVLCGWGGRIRTSEWRDQNPP